MRKESKERLLIVLKEASEDQNYTLEVREWAKRNHGRLKIDMPINGEDTATRLSMILKSASLDYRHDAKFRSWARNSSRYWKGRSGIRGW